MKTKLGNVLTSYSSTVPVFGDKGHERPTTVEN